MIRNRVPVLAALLVALCLAAPAAAAPPLAAYGALPGFEMAALSPSGNLVALVGTIEGQRWLLVVDTDGALKHRTKVDDQKIRELRFAGEDRVVLWISETKQLGAGFTTPSAELTGALVVPLNGARPFWIFQNSRQVTGGVRGFNGVAERDGHWYGYFAGITLEKSSVSGNFHLTDMTPELYEVDLADGRAKRVARRHEGHAYRQWLVGADGKIVARLEFEREDGKWRIDDAANRTLARGTDPGASVRLVALGSTPGTVVYRIEDEESGRDHWYELSLADGTPSELFKSERFRRTFVDPHTRQLIGIDRTGKERGAHFFDARREQALSLARKALPGLDIGIDEWNAAFDRLIVTTEGAGDPGTWWLVDLKAGKLTRLGVSYPLAPAEVGAVSVFRYTASDGLAMEGVLTLPPGQKAQKAPVVVLPHGGPAAHDRVGFDWWAQAFASRGYAVLQPNFRGSTGYGPEFERAGDGEWGRRMQTDVSDGLAALGREGVVDVARACIVGASYGGYAALAGVTLQQGLYRCAVSVGGVADLPDMVAFHVRSSGNDPLLRRALKRQIGSGRDLVDVSPARVAERASAPVLLIHGEDDTVVPFDQSRSMEKALRKAGKPVELLRLDGEDHWLSRGETRRAMLEAAVGFVERHNPPGSVEK